MFFYAIRESIDIILPPARPKPHQVAELSPALASEEVERRARSLYNRSRTLTSLPPAARLPPAASIPPAAGIPPAAAGRATAAPPSRADVLELRGWRRDWSLLREAQANQLEMSRDRLDAMEPGLSAALLELGQLLPGVGGLTLFVPTVLWLYLLWLSTYYGSAYYGSAYYGSAYYGSAYYGSAYYGLALFVRTVHMHGTHARYTWLARYACILHASYMHLTCI